MRCFVHPNDDAVGICRSCQKGLCRSCAVDLGQGLACQNSCEQAVRDLIVMVDYSRKAYRTGARTHATTATFSGLVSAMCFVPAALFFFGGNFIASLLMGGAGATFLYNALRFRRTHRLLKEAETITS
jgi:hypothetical protein